jgi:hypothetical protein
MMPDQSWLAMRASFIRVTRPISVLPMDYRRRRISEGFYKQLWCREKIQLAPTSCNTQNYVFDRDHLDQSAVCFEADGNKKKAVSDRWRDRYCVG